MFALIPRAALRKRLRQPILNNYLILANNHTWIPGRSAQRTELGIIPQGGVRPYHTRVLSPREVIDISTRESTLLMTIDTNYNKC